MIISSIQTEDNTSSLAPAAATWWQENGGFFGPAYMEADDSFRTFFDGSKVLRDRTVNEVSGLIKLCGLQKGSKVLDCPCGYGRHSIALAERDLLVTGVDINTRFLSLARERANRSGITVNLRHGDMRDLPSVGPVDAVVNMFYSFGFFTEDENLKVAQNFHNALKPSGAFLMHTMVTLEAFKAGRIPREERRALRSGATLISRRRLNPATLREEGEWSIVDKAGGVKVMTPYSVRIYGPEEFACLCKEAGFAEVSIYGDWEGKPYADGDAFLIAVARK